MGFREMDFRGSPERKELESGYQLGTAAGQ